jgi:putative colanic acid biosynthesis acetyltransferase WcaF
MALTHAPIRVEEGAWVCARAFVGPGVVIGKGAVVAACAVVSKDVAAWNVVVGNPATFKKVRRIEVPSTTD